MPRYSHLSLLVTCLLALLFGLSFSGQTAQASPVRGHRASEERSLFPVVGCIPGTFTNKVLGNGLGSDQVSDVFALGSTVYAATGRGLSVSNDGGNTFTNKIIAEEFGDTEVWMVYAVGSTVYAGTVAGLGISTDGGNTFAIKTTADGLGSNAVKEVYVVGSTVYAATDGGLSISTDGGNTFTNRTAVNGLYSNDIWGVYATESTIYAATFAGGLSISTDGGDTFVNRTTADGLGSNYVSGVFAVGNTVYAATDKGLSISTDGGNQFVNKTIADGLGSIWVRRVYAIDNTVYAATFGGVSISTDGGNSFSNKTTGDGLGSNDVSDIYASGSTVYAATVRGLSISVDAGGIFSNKIATVWFARDVYAVGTDVYVATGMGGLFISTDGGSSFASKTEDNGLGDNYVNGIFATGSTIYAATYGGLSISTDGGNNFVNRTTTDGLGSDYVMGVYVDGSTIYAATYGGVSISTDGGSTFTNKTTADGLGEIALRVYAAEGAVYAATESGLSISTDGGSHFVNKTKANGLGDNYVDGVYAIGSTVYAATSNGLSISTDGGNTFTNKKQIDGLGGDWVNGVFADASTVYAATSNRLSVSSDGLNTFTNRVVVNNPLGNNEVYSAYVLGGTVYAATYWGLYTSTCEPAILPGDFSKSRPINGASGQPANLALSWGASTGGTSYEYCLNVSDHHGCDGTWVSVATNTTVKLSGLSKGATYYWQVRARNEAGVNEADSGAWWSFTVASVLNDYFDSAKVIRSMPYSMILDTGKATTANDDPTFPCTKTKGAASVWYSFTAPAYGQIRANTTGSSYDTVLAIWQGTRGSLTNLACNDNSGTTRTSVAQAILVGGRTYYIEVAGRTAGGTLKLTATFTPQSPPAPKLLSPANNSQSTSASQTLDWTDSPGANYYQVQVRKVSSTGTVVDSAKPTSSTYTTKILSAGVYYWRAAACNAVGCNWTGWWIFWILRPARPALQTPGDGSTASGKAAKLDWSDSEGTTHYQVQVRKDTTSGLLVLDQKPAVSAFATPDLVSGRWYDWRVRACSPAGCSAWTSWWKFKVP